MVLETRFIWPDSHFASRDDVYRRAAHALCRAGFGQGEETLVDALFQRDASFDTYYANGIAIPHCKSEGVWQPKAMVVRNTPAVPWCAQGDAADLIFLLFTPPNAAHSHLRALARLAQILMEPQQVAKLRCAPDAAGILAILQEVNA